MLKRATCLLMTMWALQSCGYVWGVTHCDFREVETPPRCQEREGAAGAAFMAICEVTKGSPVEGPCPREDLVAGCRGETNPAMVATDWYYRAEGAEPVRTRDDVKPICDEDGYTLVDP
ncbi:MAG: hypothetical protein AB2A00_02950 [Myxococcota bacterium]